ncbi:MAG: DUF5615 family PIN-like protein [Caldilineales bacterium]|nr:DUF5615 family PIN-like protein [Caldilineales bacterium]
MSPLCLLFDENVPSFIQAQLARLEPGLRMYRVGDDPAPATGTPDAAILLWIEAHGCMLVTNNRASMPSHLADRLALGHHVPGIIQLPQRMNVRVILDDLRLICAAARPDEFLDQIV